MQQEKGFSPDSVIESEALNEDKTRQTQYEKPENSRCHAALIGYSFSRNVRNRIVREKDILADASPDYSLTLFA